VVDVDAVAHGGHCVARHQGRVVFVRHALPGERVRFSVTDGGPTSTFWRADAVEVLRASPDRVAPPCPWSGPGRCGGCDWQHADPAAQRTLKAAVVHEQLARLAGVERDVVVDEVPGAPDGLGWRTRVQYAVDDAGRAGLRPHRSHDVVPVDWCRIAHPAVVEAGVTGRRWPGHGSVEVIASSAGDRMVLVDGRPADGDRAEAVEEVAGGRRFRVSRSGFWQVHPGAPEALLGAALAALDPQPGERALDLYAGVGLFAAGLAERLGPGGRVTAVESDARAVADARRNLADLTTVRVLRGRVDHVLRRRGLGRADLVVLDPPRSGAGRAVVDLLAAAGSRRICYVACDPAALARDVERFGRRGYRLTGLQAFDLFPMTHHVECVAVLEPNDRAQG
jgi:tRNA/tmRNA/rRNA uracil-C5-methylase (TrmA/RlmC/RlmD family)